VEMRLTDGRFLSIDPRYLMGTRTVVALVNLRTFIAALLLIATSPLWLLGISFPNGRVLSIGSL
jgi:hypothetical protein